MADKTTFLPKLGCWMEGYGPYCEVADFDSFGYDGEGVGTKDATPNDGPGYASHVVCMQNKTNKCLERFNECLYQEIDGYAKELRPKHYSLGPPAGTTYSYAYTISHIYRVLMGRETYLGFGPGPFIKGPRLVSRLNPLDVAYKRIELHPFYTDRENHAVSDTLHILHTRAKRICYSRMSSWVDCDYTTCFCPLKKCVRCEDDIEIKGRSTLSDKTTNDPSVSGGKNIKRHKASIDATESSYAKMIPVVIGTGVLSGNVIEVGKGRVETITIETESTVEEVEIPITSFAISLAASEIPHLLRVWVNDKIVYNKMRIDESPSFNTTLYQDLSKYGLGDYKISFNPKVEFYTGARGQKPFRSLDGSRIAIGYRDHAVIVFRDWAFGTSSLPSIRVELSTAELDFGNVTSSAPLPNVTHDPVQMSSGDFAVATTDGIEVLNTNLLSTASFPVLDVLRFGVTETNDIFYTRRATPDTLNVVSLLNSTPLSFKLSLSPQHIISVKGKSKVGAPITVFFAASAALVQIVQFDGDSFTSAGTMTLNSAVTDAYAYNGPKSFALFVGSGTVTRVVVTNSEHDFDPFNLDLTEYPYSQSALIARTVNDGIILVAQESAWFNSTVKQSYPGLPRPDPSNVKFSGNAIYTVSNKDVTISLSGRSVLVDNGKTVVSGNRALYDSSRQAFISLVGNSLAFSNERGLPTAVPLRDLLIELNTRLLSEYRTAFVSSSVAVYGIVLKDASGLRDLYANVSTIFNYRWENGVNASSSSTATFIDNRGNHVIKKTKQDKISDVKITFIDQDKVKSVRSNLSLGSKVNSKSLELSVPIFMSTAQAQALAQFTGERMQGRTDVTAELNSSSAYQHLTSGDVISFDGGLWRIDSIIDDLPNLKYELSAFDHAPTLISDPGPFIPNAYIKDQSSNSGIEIVNVPLVDDEAADNTTNFYVIGKGSTGRVEYSFPSITAAKNTSSRSLSADPVLSGVLSVIPPPLQRLEQSQPEGSFAVLFTTPQTLAAFNLPVARDWGKNTLIVGREIIRYTSVSLSLDGLTATFSGLLRGLRNTDIFAHTHTLNERVLVYDERKFVPVIGPRGANGESRRVKLRLADKVSNINIQRKLVTDYTLPPILLRRDERQTFQPSLMHVPRFWNAQFIQNPNQSLVLSGPPLVDISAINSNVRHIFGTPAITAAFFHLEAAFDRETFISNFSLTPNSYVRRLLRLNTGPERLYIGSSIPWTVKDLLPSHWALFGVDADGTISTPEQRIIAFGTFAPDGAMYTEPTSSLEFNQVGTGDAGESSLHSRLFGFNHIVPEGFSLPEN